jgi:putative redox protein
MSITVIRDTSQPMRHVVHLRSHEIAVDGSVAEGGSDLGPDPHDLYDAALGACKALTIMWYANRKGIPVGDVKVSVDRDASEERKGTYRLATKLELGGELTEAQRQELLTVAQKCPLHKLMTAVTTEITTELVQP